MARSALQTLGSWLSKASPSTPDEALSPREMLGAWLAKSAFGVHAPSGKNSGNSAAGQATRSHASAGPTTGRKATDKKTAVAAHQKVIGEMRSMKKPNLPKSHESADDDTVEKAIDALAAWNSKQG